MSRIFILVLTCLLSSVASIDKRFLENFSVAGTTQASACHTSKADLIFVLDSSTSEGSANFEKQKQFVAKFVENFNIGSNEVQVALLTFSSHTYIYFNLHDHQDKTSLINAINGVTYHSGNTNTGLALDVVNQIVLTPQKGDRQDAQNIVFVLTDGQSQDSHATAVAAAKLKQAGDKIFAIGIGSQITSSELENIATDHEHVFKVATFDDLHHLGALLQKTYCESMSSTPCRDLTDCTRYGSSICTDPRYTSFASSKCAHYCHFCTAHSVAALGGHSTSKTSPQITSTTAKSTTSSAVVDCYDKIDNCDEYTLSICTSSVTWAVKYCADYCNLCNMVTNGPAGIQSSHYVSMSTSTTPQTTSATSMSTIGSTTTDAQTPPPLHTGPCVDTFTNCAGYGQSVCTDYRTWAITHCARFCLFCHDENQSPPPLITTSTAATTTRVYDKCEDKVDSCETYGPDMCTDHYDWAAVQCPKFCLFCKATESTTTTTTAGIIIGRK